MRDQMESARENRDMDGAPRVKRCMVRMFASAAEAAAAERTAWPAPTPQESLALVWPMTLEQYRLAGIITDEPQLCRTIMGVELRQRSR